MGKEVNSNEKMLVVGVAGGSGSGKTTVAQNLAKALGPKCSIISFDNYYVDRPDLTDSERSAINYDHPNALQTSLLKEHIETLKLGRLVHLPQYDFITHRRKKGTMELKPCSILIVEGILALAEPSIRELLDIKIFVDTDPDIRVMRRIRRDLEQRGRKFSSIRNRYYNHVRPMHLEFVEPSKKWSDLIIPEGGDNKVANDIILARLNEHIRLN